MTPYEDGAVVVCVCVCVRVCAVRDRNGIKAIGERLLQYPHFNRQTLRLQIDDLFTHKPWPEAILYTAL